MNQLDKLSAAFISIFLIYAILRGKENAIKLWELLKRDKSFLAFAVSAYVLFFIAKNKTFGDGGKMIVFAAFIGFFFATQDKLFPKISELWNKIKGG